MASEIRSRRVSWIALALSLMAAGVGHVYCGRIAKALPLFFAWLLIPLGCILSVMLPPSALGLALLLLPPLTVLIVYLYAASDAWRLARRIDTDYSLQDFNRPVIYFLLIVVQLVFSIGLIVGVRHAVYEAYVIPVDNMRPTILSGDRVLARKLLPPDDFPARGDVVVYRNPTSTGSSRFLGRVVAVSGDEVEIEGARLLINGKELGRDRIPSESLVTIGVKQGEHVAYEENAGLRYRVTYVDSPADVGSPKSFKTTVPERHLFVVGDNRDRSRDSRHFGSIHSGEIVGYVDYVFWPSVSWSRFGRVNGGPR